MQAAANLTPSSLSRLIPTIPLAPPLKSFPNLKTTKFTLSVKAVPSSNEVSAVDYSSSMTSVFPAEACEIVGGDACEVEMYPETKLKPNQTNSSTKRAPETADREYLDYNDNNKTVFPAEACDDLGGEFCEPDYQTGVY